MENVHEPLIDRDTFEIVQEKVKQRQRPDAWGNYGMFAGLVKCGQCGSTMNIRRANQKSSARIFTCSTYNRFGVKHCSQHRITYDALYKIVLDKIREYAGAALEDEAKVAAASQRLLLLRMCQMHRKLPGAIQPMNAVFAHSWVSNR